MADDLYWTRERLRCDLFLTIFCIIRMKFIAVKKLRQEKSVMASGGWDGGAPEGGGDGGSGSFCSRLNLGIGGGQASSGEESR